MPAISACCASSHEEQQVDDGHGAEPTVLEAHEQIGLGLSVLHDREPDLECVLVGVVDVRPLELVGEHRRDGLAATEREA